jgi:hypothetical protein
LPELSEAPFIFCPGTDTRRQEVRVVELWIGSMFPAHRLQNSEHTNLSFLNSHALVRIEIYATIRSIRCLLPLHSLSALSENGLHPTHLNRTTETALRLDVEVPWSDPSDNNGGIPSTVNNGQKKKKNYINFNDRCEDLKSYKEKNGHLSVREKDDKSLYDWCRWPETDKFYS